MSLQAVLTGDIVNSTRLSKVNEKKLLKNLKAILVGYRYEFYRGDSFQVFVKNADDALRVALLCRAAAISLTATELSAHCDIRISIGIGAARVPGKELSAAKGEPFVLSGRMFDKITNEGTRLAIATTNRLGNTAFGIISDYLNSIFDMMTDKQAIVIFDLLNGKTQKAVAGKLKKSKSTISQHVMSGRWYEIEKLLNHYSEVVAQLK